MTKVAARAIKAVISPVRKQRMPIPITSRITNTIMHPI